MGEERRHVRKNAIAFRYYLRVRYIECDAQKVVFNSRYAEYVDVSVTEFLRAAGILHEFVHGGLDFQLVKQTVEWKAPARYDQVLELSVTPKHLGNTSFTLLTEFRIADPPGDDRVIVTVETIYVLVDAQTLTKMPLPDRIRAVLQSGAKGQQTDHAGFNCGFRTPQSAMTAYPFSDLSLARRLERAEGEASARFVEARSRLEPASGASWIDVAGTYAMFDGPESPITQTFGFGLFAPPSAERLDELEQFFRDRGAPAFHEVSPMADREHGALLARRGYEPFEFTSVMYQPIASDVPDPAASTRIAVRVVADDDAGDQDLWSTTAADGWAEQPELREFILGIARVHANNPGTRLFLAEEDGRAIAAAALSLANGVALFAGASTIPEGRGRGAQLALLASRLSYAADHGCDLAMMCAAPGSGSQRNAERHGFRIAYTRLKWRMKS